MESAPTFDMLTFIPTPIGNPQDITLRAMKIFEKATLFLCEDTRQTKRLLRLLEERFGMVYPEADFLSFNEHNGAARLEQISQRLEAEAVVYVSDAGMPAISDPGQLLVVHCQAQGIAYDVLPGASAVTTVYAASGFESGKFLFFAFLPHKGKERAAALDVVMNSAHDVVLYEAPHRLEKLLSEIVSIDADRELFLAKEVSKKYQHYYRGSAEILALQLAETTIRGEWALVIEGKRQKEKSLSFDQVFSLPLPPKAKAKLLASLSDKSTNTWYEIIIKN